MGRSLTSLPEPRFAPPRHNRINLPRHPRQRQSLHHSIPPILSKHLRALRRRSSFDCKRAHPALQIDRRLGVRVLRLRRSRAKSRVQIPRMDGGRDHEDLVVGAVVDGAGKGGVGAGEFPVADGHGGALDAVVVVVAVAAVEYGRVDGLRRLLDIRAVE